MIGLIQTQLALECIGFDQDGLLVRIPGPEPDEIARVYAFHLVDGHLLYFRHDVPPSVRQQISALGAESAFHNQERVKALLALDAPCQVHCWQTYFTATNCPILHHVPWRKAWT